MHFLCGQPKNIARKQYRYKNMLCNADCTYDNILDYHNQVLRTNKYNIKNNLHCLCVQSGQRSLGKNDRLRYRYIIQPVRQQHIFMQLNKLGWYLIYWNDKYLSSC